MRGRPLQGPALLSRRDQDFLRREMESGLSDEMAWSLFVQLVNAGCRPAHPGATPWRRREFMGRASWHRIDERGCEIGWMEPLPARPFWRRWLDRWMA